VPERILVKAVLGDPVFVTDENKLWRLSWNHAAQIHADFLESRKGVFYLVKLALCEEGCERDLAFTPGVESDQEIGCVRIDEQIIYCCYVFLSPRAEALAHPAKGEALRRSGA